MLLTNCYSITKIDKSIRNNLSCYNCGNRPNHAIITFTGKLRLYLLCAKDVEQIHNYTGNLDSISIVFMKRYLLLNKFQISNDLKLILGIK